MDDDRTRGWLLARLVLAIAVLAVIAIPLLARPSPSPACRVGSHTAIGSAPIIAEAIAIVGLVWMVRIWRGPARDARRQWRYRE